ncbi:MAG: hypothetical protein R3F61_03795 [Myxococcota bacterium]
MTRPAIAPRHGLVESLRDRVQALSASVVQQRAEGPVAAGVIEDLRVAAYQLAAEDFSGPESLGAIALAEGCRAEQHRERGELRRAAGCLHLVGWLRGLLHDPEVPETGRELLEVRLELASVLVELDDVASAEGPLGEAVDLAAQLERLSAEDAVLAGLIARCNALSATVRTSER